MAIFELKVEVALVAIAAIEEFLGEQEVQHLMVVEDKPAERAWLTGYFDSLGAAQAGWDRFAELLDAKWLLSEPRINELEDKNWKESYKEHFKAWKFDRLNWVPVWERESFRLPAGEEVLWLDPGMAFGTGNHETTRLVVERLVESAAQRGVKGRLIDAGCGSGILALSAAKLGYARVAGFDNDPLAIDVSRENAALNDLEGRVDFYVADLVTGLAGRQAELILANIQADILVKFATLLVGSMAPAGVLVLSGILASELEQVHKIYAARAPGCTLESRIMGEWSDLVLRST